MSEAAVTLSFAMNVVARANPISNMPLSEPSPLQGGTAKLALVLAFGKRAHRLRA